MRHRITSFRCVVASSRMFGGHRLFKSCNGRQLRQSSMLRAASGQAGITSGAAPAAVIATRPRLNARASSRGSVASTALPGGRTRSLLVVVTRSWAPGTTEGRINETRRVANAQRTVNRTPRASRKMASLPPGMARQLQLPAFSGISRHVAGAGGGGAAAAGAGTACSAREAAIVSMFYRPSLSTLAFNASSSALSAATSVLSPPEGEAGFSSRGAPVGCVNARAPS